MDFNANYQYSKAKIINENDNDNSYKNNTSNNDNLDKKTIKDQIKQIDEENIKNKSEKINIDKNSNPDKITKNFLNIMNTTVIKKINNDIQFYKDKKDIEVGIIYKNITIQNKVDYEKLKNDLNIFNIDFLNNINVTNYLKRNKTLKLIINFNFKEKYTKSNEIEKKVLKPKNKSLNNKNIKLKNSSNLNQTNSKNFINSDKTFNNKTHLEKKIKDFIKQKILNKTLNVSNIYNVSKKEIHKIVSDFHEKEIKKTNNIRTVVENKKSSSITKEILIKNLSNNLKIENSILKSKELLYKNIDKVSDRLSQMFKKVLKDIVLNPFDYILEGKLENNLSFMKQEIKSSLSESLENLNKNDIKMINTTKNIVHNNIDNDIKEKVKNNDGLSNLNKTSKDLVQTIRNLSNMYNKSNKLNFIESKSAINNKYVKKGSELKNDSLNNRKETNKEIDNLINKKIDKNDKIDFILKKSYSKKIAVAFQTNSSIYNSSKMKNKDHYLNEADYKLKNFIHNKATEFDKINLILNKTFNSTKDKVLNKSIKYNNNNKNLIIKNKTLKNNKIINKQEFQKIIKKIESEKKSLYEIEKKIISKLPKIKKILEDKKVNIPIIKEEINKMDRKPEKQGYNINLKNNHTNINDVNKALNINISSLENNKSIKEKEIKSSKNLRKENNLPSQTNDNNKNSIFSNLNLNKKSISQVNKNDQKEIHSLSKAKMVKTEKVKENLEIDDGSVMAEILKAYKNRIKNKKA